MGVDDHRQQAALLGSFAGGVLTISDSRSEADDESGAAIRALIEAGGHRVRHYAVVRNDPAAVRQTVQEWVAAGADFIITTGGTGLSPRDQTIETLRPLLDKELDGFGELFRHLSFQAVGTAALLSRATGGSVGRSLLFCLPGSKAAVQLATERLILPELKHLLSQVRKA